MLELKGRMMIVALGIATEGCGKAAPKTRRSRRRCCPIYPVEHHHRQAAIAQLAAPQLAQRLTRSLHERSGTELFDVDRARSPGPRRRARACDGTGGSRRRRASVPHDPPERIAIREMLVRAQLDLGLAVSGPDPGPLSLDATAAERHLASLVALADRGPVGVVLALRAHHVVDLFFHQFGQDAEPRDIPSWPTSVRCGAGADGDRALRRHPARARPCRRPPAAVRHPRRRPADIKACPAWLAGLDDVVQIAIGPDDAGRNPDSVVGMRVSAPYRTLLAGLTAGVVAAAGTSGWRRGARRTTPPDVGIGENCLDDRFLVMSRRHWPYQLVVTGGHRIRKR